MLLSRAFPSLIIAVHSCHVFLLLLQQMIPSAQARMGGVMDFWRLALPVPL
jgi:hypothetical protein